ncbi:MAG TPA: DUF4426 domain-containing protein [Cellvibrio sp.]
MKKLLQGIFLSLVAITVQAQVDQPKEISTTEKFGDYTIHYNVFNSTDIPASVAETYKLVRGKDRALVNISLTKTENGSTSLGLPAVVTGASKNLMQQKQTLTFIEIKEGDATYYLAPFVFNNEEVLHFDIQVSAKADAKPMSFTFNRTLYTE